MTTPTGVLDLFVELARLPTPSGAERASADACLDYLRSLGLQPDEDDTGPSVGSDAGNIYVELPPTTTGTRLFFCAHLDTVPVAGPIDPVCENGVVTNRYPAILGADNKASVAAMLEAIRTIVRDGVAHAGVELILTTKEEVGLRGAKAFDVSRLKAGLGYVYDHVGALGGVVIAAAGQNSIDLVFTGRAAHSGIAPAEGRSAIAAAAAAIAPLRLGVVDEETTANVGRIEGGVARNIIPATCTVTAEVRSRDSARLAAETQRVLDSAAGAAAREQCSLESTVRSEFSPYRHRRGDAVVMLARRGLQAAGYTPREERVGGGADAHVFNAAGIPCIVLTSGMMLVHTPEERIAVSDLEGMVAITLALVRTAASAA